MLSKPDCFIVNRFNATKEFKKLHPILKALRQKEVDLKTLVDDDAAHPIYMKSVILTTLTEQIDKIINQFNKEPRATEYQTELMQLHNLVVHLKKTVISVVNKYESILNTPRSSIKKIVPQFTTPAAVTSTVGVGFATGSFLFALVPLAATLALSYVAEQKGLYNPTTATILILEHLTNTLKTIENSLRFFIKELLIDATEPPTFLCCPITQQRMQHPVLCTLDNRMYEKKAIMEWLTTQKTSPFTREPLQPHQTIENVLIENITLRSALEELESMQPQNISPLAPPIEDIPICKLNL